MDDLAYVSIPVPKDVAERLRSDEDRARVGRVLSELMRPASPESDPLKLLIDAIKDQAHGTGLTDAMIDAELAAYNAERRS
jgi:hypothetical protein